MWVVDGLEDKLFAYVLTPGRTFGNRVSAKDIALAIDAPMGIWSDGTTMWVAESVDNKLYAYALTSGDPLSPLDLALDTDDTDSALDNGDPRGIWSDGTTMWVADNDDNKVYTYALLRLEDLTRSRIWSAELTAKTHNESAGRVGYGRTYAGSAISDTTITSNDVPYVEQFAVWDQVSLVFEVAGDGIGPKKVRTWNLDVEGTLFAFADAKVFSTANRQFTWSNSGLSWADGDKIDVGIIAPANVAATGPKPTISGRFRVGLPLTAHPSAVTDLNGIPDNVSYTYQWYRFAKNFGGAIDAEVLIDGATESTYTPTESEQGWKMKVQVGFTDSEGFQESMTSDPTDEAVKTRATEIWSAKLTPKPSSSGLSVGFGASYPGSALSDNTIDYGPKTYRVRDINLTPDTGVLLFQLDRQPTEGETGTWILEVGGTEVSLANSITPPQSGRFAWSGSSLSWSDGDMIDVSLFALPSDATGQPAITGRLRVGGTLTPDMSGVVDANGIPDDLSYQWVSRDGTTDTDIEGATASTYTLTESELGKTIKVRVGFTDHAGYEESVTSDATAAVGVRANEFWSAKLTVKLSTSGATVGFGEIYQGSTLSDATITYGPRTFTVSRFGLDGAPNLLVLLDQHLTGEDLDTWILDVGGKEFPLRAGHFGDDATTNSLGFFRPGLSWSDGDMIDLSLLALNSEATGQPDISSDGSRRFPRAGDTLTAGVSPPSWTPTASPMTSPTSGCPATAPPTPTSRAPRRPPTPSPGASRAPSSRSGSASPTTRATRRASPVPALASNGCLISGRPR